MLLMHRSPSRNNSGASPDQHAVSGEVGSPDSIAPELVTAWMSRVDELGIIGQTVELQNEAVEGEPPTTETVTVHDAVYLEANPRRQPTHHFSSGPVVIIQRSNGEHITLPAENFLRRSGFDTDDFQETLRAEEAAKRQETAQRIAEMEAVQTARVAAQEAAQKQRNVKLFAPIVTSRERVTEESRQQAADRLNIATQQDLTLKELLRTHGRELDTSDLSVVTDALRTDVVLRGKVGAYLLTKINKFVREQPAHFPSRVIDNGEKSPHRAELATISNMCSREYVALLCLTKLDGSFDYAGEEKDIGYDEKGVAVSGQHRAAADTILGLPS